MKIKILEKTHLTMKWRKDGKDAMSNDHIKNAIFYYIENFCVCS